MMADEIQLQVSIDLESLKTSAEAAAQVIGKAMSGAATSALGALGPAGGGGGGNFGGAAAAAGMKTISDVESTLQLILQALQQGFHQQAAVQTAAANQVAAQVQATSGAGGAKPLHQLPPPGTPQAGGGFFGGIPQLFGFPGKTTPQQQHQMSMLGAIGSMGGMAGQATEAVLEAYTRGTASSKARAGQTIAGMLPGMGGWASAFGSLAKHGENQEEGMDMMYQLARGGGPGMAQSFERRWLQQGMSGERVNQGMTAQQDFAQRMKMSRSMGTHDEIMPALEARLGLGDFGIDMAGAFRRSGGTQGTTGPGGVAQVGGSSASEQVGAAIGVALATNLEQGRWGEAVDLMAKSAQTVMHANVDLQRVTDMNAMIGRMGTQYQGDTSSARDMATGLTNLAQGKGGGAARVMAMLAYKKANPEANLSEIEAGLAKGPLATGGLSIAQAVSQYAPMIKTQIAAGHSDDSIAGNMNRQFPGVMDILAWIQVAKLVRENTPLENLVSKQQMTSIADQISRSDLSGVSEKRKGDARVSEKAMASLAGQEQYLTPDVQKPRWDPVKKQWVIPTSVGGAGASPPVLVPQNPPGTDIDIDIGPAAVTPMGGGAQSIPPPTTQSSGSMLTPTSFIDQWVPTSGTARFGANRGGTPHPGHDFVFPPGTVVTSPVDGRVQAAVEVTKSTPKGGMAEGDGMFISIQATGGGPLWKVLHLDPATVRVKEGDQVLKGKSVLGKTLPFSHWKNKTGGKGVATHAHVSVQPGGEKGAFVDPSTQGDLRNLVGPSEGGTAAPDGPATSPTPGPVLIQKFKKSYGEGRGAPTEDDYLPGEDLMSPPPPRPPGWKKPTDSNDPELGAPAAQRRINATRQGPQASIGAPIGGEITLRFVGLPPGVSIQQIASKKPRGNGGQMTG